MTLRGLRGKVGEGEGGREGRAHALEVWAEGLGLADVSNAQVVGQQRNS